MKQLISSIYKHLLVFGFDPRQTFRSVKGLPYFFKNLHSLKKQAKSTAVIFPFGTPYPCLSDRFSDSGYAKGHYFYQDLLVARNIHRNNPDNHVDVGSRIDGFVTHVAAFRPITVFDIRPLASDIPNVTFVQADLMANIDDALVAYCDSLSCLHAMEHFGLGRYGDPVNYDGYLLGLQNLHRILKPGGKLYFSVPIGPQRIEFDAHRVFSMDYLLQLFEDRYQIEHFSYVDDQGALHENVELSISQTKDNFGCQYGCGIFEMTKLS